MFGKVFNVGYGEGVSLIEVTKVIARFIPATKIVYKPWPKIEKKIETGDYISDISLVKKVTGWSPKVNFEDGIEETIKFYEQISK
jgi:nucleoside-diphosphate-sugar epimerase